MKPVTRLLRGLIRHLKDVRGVTLYETTAVVAMTAILAAVALPVALDKIEAAKSAKAAQEVTIITKAIASFFEDTGRMPGEVEIRTDGTSCFLQTGRPGSDPQTSALLPTLTRAEIGTIDTGDFLPQASLCATFSHTNALNINDYLVRKPNPVDYPSWQGPYMEPITADPWNQAYVINVLPLMFAEAITAGVGAAGTPDAVTGAIETGGDLGYAWVLSVGPDRLLQTRLTDSVLAPATDDVGQNLGKRIEKVQSGVS
ncbi:MAG: hypothetical protein ACE5JD_00280 [Candidatus Methylomirabilia bacterium]